MGDNRNHSTDSRHIGSLPIDKVDGVVIADFKSDLLLTFEKTMNQFVSFLKSGWNIRCTFGIYIF